ncbi:hypothetical protein [uncultured Draconibacterium sp.]|uniref:hypothetical protein n=1 Tax=uncultured Draconibacterium sp. TaxID=1573823 RepID=UPI0025EFEAD2|nr:hypothetical protein [uncultured Draconibacterium sp.]
MSEKKQSTQKSEKRQGTSTIKFWLWSLENVELNLKTIMLSWLHIFGIGIIALLLIYILVKMGLFEYVIRIIEATKA